MHIYIEREYSVASHRISYFVATMVCVHLKHGLSRNKESGTADDPHYSIGGLMCLLIHVGVISVNQLHVGSEGACKQVSWIAYENT